MCKKHFEKHNNEWNKFSFKHCLPVRKSKNIDTFAVTNPHTTDLHWELKQSMHTAFLAEEAEIPPPLLVNSIFHNIQT